MKMRAFSTILLAATTLATQAQHYVVTTRRDTLRGRISMNSYSNMDKAQLIADKKKTEYPATSLIMVRLDSQIFQPVRTADAYRLMRVSRLGPASLLYARQSPGTPYNVPFVVKRTGESMEVTALRFKKSMATFLKDCQTIREKIEQEKLGRKDLERIIEEYNLCLEQQTQKAFVANEDPRIAALDAMRARFEKDDSIPQDARDILKDLYSKVKENKAIPNYLIEGLRQSVQGRMEYQPDIETLISKLKN